MALFKRKKAKEKELKEGVDYKLTPEAKKEEKKEPYVKLSLNKEMKDKFADIILTQVVEAESNPERKKFIEHLEYCRKRYSMEDLDTDFPWEGASKRRTGGTTIAVDRLKPRVKKAIFYSGHIVDIIPEANNTEENAEKQEKWLDYTIREVVKLEEKSDNLLYDALMLNFGVLKNHWVFEEEKREEVTEYESADELLRNYPDAIEKYPEYILKLTGYDTMEHLAEDYPQFANLPLTDTKITLRETYRDKFDGDRVEWVDPKDIIFPKDVEKAEDSWVIIQHLRMRRDELMRKQKSKFFEFNEKDLFGDKEAKDYGKKYDVYEAILRYDIDKDGLEEKCVYWVAKGEGDNKLYLRGIKYPYMHRDDYFIVFRSTGHRYGFYTGGLGEKLKSVSDSEDKRQNQISNAWDQAIVKSFLHTITPGSPYNPKIHKYYPASIIPVSDPNELTELRTSDIPPSSFTLLEDNRRESELLAGVSINPMSGQVTPQDPNAPARKTELLLAESNISTSEYLKNIIKGIKRVAYQIQMNYYQFTDTSEVNYRTDKGFENISKQEMRGKVMFTCRSAIESVSAQQKAQSNVALLNILMNHPLVAQNYQFQWTLIRSIVVNWSEELAQQIEKLFSPEIKELIISQLKQAEALAQQQQQIEEYQKKRKAEGASPEIIQMELQQMMGGQGGGGQGGQPSTAGAVGGI